MKKIASITSLLLCLCCMASGLLACNGTRPGDNKEYTPRTKTVSYAHFNTVTVLSSYGDTTAEEFEGYVKTVDEQMGYYHKLFDIYYEYAGINNLCTVNKNAGVAPVAVEEELIDFLLYCKQLYSLTKGKTNVMLGSVLRIWHDKRELADAKGGYLDEHLLPTQEELEKAAAHTAIELLVIDQTAKTVYISDPEASIDVGAIAKGYAAERVASQLKAGGADSMALNAGGNIVTIGLKPNGDLWVTGITNPDRTAENSLICRVEMGEISLVTSGDYERYFVSGDQRYHHVIDPETRMPAAYFASVSVFVQDGALADALSTALFCMSYEEGLALVQSIGGIEVLWIGKDGTMQYTDGVRLVD